MNRTTPIRPALNQELQHWQRQSESKIPPGAPRQRIHELPGLAAENEAAATPTIDEELPVTDDDVDQPLDEGENPHGEEPPAPPAQGLVEDAVLERFEDDGGSTNEEDSGAEPRPDPVDPAIH